MVINSDYSSTQNETLFPVGNRIYRLDRAFKKSLLAASKTIPEVREAWFEDSILHQRVEKEDEIVVESVDVVKVYSTMSQDACEALDSLGVKPVFDATVYNSKQATGQLNLKDFN